MSGSAEEWYDVAEALRSLEDVIGPSGSGHFDCMKQLMLRGGGKGVGQQLFVNLSKWKRLSHPSVAALILKFRAFVSGKVASYARYQYFCKLVQRRTRPYFEWLDRRAFSFVKFAVRDYLVPEWPQCHSDLLSFLDVFEEHRASLTSYSSGLEQT